MLRKLQRVLSEIHRRSLWQVLGVYVVASWVVLQVVETLTDSLTLPEWFPPLAFGLLLVGLPVVLATAFVQEGVQRDGADSGADAPTGRVGPGSAEVQRGSEGAAAATGSPPGRARRLFTWRNAIGGGVLALALWGALAAGWLVLGGGPAATADADDAAGHVRTGPTSIAVLPFADLSPEGDQEYFADGVAEEILNALANVPDLRVAARTSAFSFKGESLGIREIGERLGVATVLEGSVRKAGDRVRVTAQLVSVDDGFHLWSDTYDRELRDIFAVQDQVARAVVGALQVELVGSADTTLVPASTTSPAAHDEYLRGRFHWNRRTLEGLETAIHHFERAIAADSGHARAWAGLADAHALLPWYSADVDAGRAFETAQTAAERALALDSRLGQPHAVLGWVALYRDFDWDRARREFGRAIELNPAYATAHQWYAIMLSFQGRHEQAGAEAQRAVALDPLSLVINATAAGVMDRAGDYQGALDRYRETLDLDPNFALAWFGVARTETRLGRFEEAADALARWAALRGRDTTAARALIEAVANGHASELFADDDPTLQRLGLTAGRLAWFAALAELPEATVRWLERAYEERSPEFLLLGVDPVFDFLHDDPRFVDLLRRVGLEAVPEGAPRG